MTNPLNDFLRNHAEDKDRAIRALFVSIGFHHSLYHEQIDDIMYYANKEFNNG
ncbi:hypothetical protein SEA_C3PO_86 [Corynebacterium phage C3PO]|uniref:Uncharacterized protein n=2 Tax=Corynebacterium virus C3PO TaxID=2560393 RepID=A0A3G3LW43_9CAUD|nr:hypothetical protein FDJ10_gp57 [Corynebacterium phage C3PO]ATW58528.1 hypothetical protein SEA_C3PO_86 [Corynebacterium phage C3PO]AYQ98382.1 hypothetical protein CRUELLA_86 [Corynebacterium phage Cruella]